MAWKLKNLFSQKPDSVQSIPVQPGADVWFQRGNTHASRQEWQPALDCYREAIRADPNHAGAHAFSGNVLRQLGDPDAAMVAYGRAIAIKPDFAEVHYNRGAVLQQARQTLAALESYDTALAVNPSFTEAHCNRGDVLKELGRADEALASYRTAIATHGGYARAYLHRGILQQQLGQRDAAEASYRQAIVLRPDYADAHFNLGTLHRDAGRNTDALTNFNDAIAVAPDHAGAHAERGIALMELGELDAAVTSFDTAISLRPDFARVFSNRARAQAKLGLAVAARASHDRAILLDPQDAALHFNRGVFLSDHKDWGSAAASYHAALELKPDYADAHCNLGLVQQESGAADAALDSYSRALQIDPQSATAFNNRGNLYRNRMQFAQSLPDYRQAIALDPNFADAHFNISQLALLQGHFAVGWPEYEWRRLIKEALVIPARTFAQPAWFGDQPLQGKRMLLYPEQGLGDTIQFCRYVSKVAALGAHVTLEVQRPLGGLLANLDGVSQWVSSGAPVPHTDYRCSLMSLPGAFKTTLETIPSDVPYLRAEPSKVTRWHEFLGARTKPRVGLAWSGNPRQSNDHNRSIELAQWIEHLPDEFEYFCLQKDIRDADQQLLRSSTKITALDSHLNDFTDTAALIETLDLVISVDTSLAHLSGAMGKETWVLLCFLPDWRWLMNRRDSPWYPTATLYRQPAANDWDSVAAQVTKDLLARLR